MKRIAFILSALFLLSAFKMPAGVDEVISAIKAGSASSVAKYFDNTVEISIPGKSNSYSRSQGEVVLRDFFANNSVKSFTVIHRGGSNGAGYFIGTLVTASGSYRTTVNLKQKGDRQTLQEIKFEN